MTFHWDSKAVKQYIETNVPNVKKVTIDKCAGGSYDSLGMVVSLTNKEKLLLTPWRDYIGNLEHFNQILDNVDIKFVELSDGEADSRGGLQSKSKITAQAYIAIRQYFLDNGIEEVINHYDQIY